MTTCVALVLVLELLVAFVPAIANPARTLLHSLTLEPTPFELQLLILVLNVVVLEKERHVIIAGV